MIGKAVAHDMEEASMPQKLRYACILTDHKENRWIVARLEWFDYPLVFNRTMIESEGEFYDIYALYQNALTAEEADEILDERKYGSNRKATMLLKRYVKRSDAICEDVGEVQLDDWIPDDWYDAWKEMEVFITSTVDLPGYYEDTVSTDCD